MGKRVSWWWQRVVRPVGAQVFSAGGGDLPTVVEWGGAGAGASRRAPLSASANKEPILHRLIACCVLGCERFLGCCARWLSLRATDGTMLTFSSTMSRHALSKKP